jgi:DNA invertase Pin-like site-specific DNA recombinase
MQVVVWARVSSREQREGYSLDAQLRVARDRARANGWTIAREFVVAESAKRGSERTLFNEMLAWVRANAKRQSLRAILSHKLDRVCRNMRDAVRLQELEDGCGVQLAFVDNQFGSGAAGALSFNVMAAVAQYYSDNLRSEVLKGMDERVRQGWPTGLAPFGYINVADRDEPVQPHPEKALTLVRIFELYGSGGFTFKSLGDRLEQEGHAFRPGKSRFHRGALAHILSNRFYVGELHRGGQIHEGRYRVLITRAQFEACQDVLHGRNRRTGSPDIPLSGRLLQCAFCGQSITGERIKRSLAGGGVREHTYYRCANNAPGPDHPKVRWKSDDLERAIADDLGRLRMPTPEVAAWFRTALAAAFEDLTAHRRTQGASLAKRKAELATMQDRLLNAYLAGTVDEEVHVRKSSELKQQLARIDEDLQRLPESTETRADAALRLFDLAQSAGETWLRSNNTVRRELVDAVCLNRQLTDVTLVTTKRKPFDALAEGLDLQNSRGDSVFTEPKIGFTAADLRAA